MIDSPALSAPALALGDFFEGDAALALFTPYERACLIRTILLGPRPRVVVAEPCDTVKEES